MSFRNHRAHLDDNHKPIVAALEAAGVYVVNLATVGGGCPDLLCYRRAVGLLRLLEIKNPDTTMGKRGRINRRSATELKQEAFRSIVPVWVVHTVTEALEAMEISTTSEILKPRVIRSAGSKAPRQEGGPR